MAFQEQKLYVIKKIFQQQMLLYTKTITEGINIQHMEKSTPDKKLYSK